MGISANFTATIARNHDGKPRKDIAFCSIPQPTCRSDIAEIPVGLKGPVCPMTQGMNNTLWNPFSIKVDQLLTSCGIFK